MEDDKDKVVVNPLPFEEPSPSGIANMVEQLIAQDEGRPGAPVKHAIRVILDEIDVAAAIPGADQRIRVLTKKIRNLL